MKFFTIGVAAVERKVFESVEKQLPCYLRENNQDLIIDLSNLFDEDRDVLKKSGISPLPQVEFICLYIGA